MEFMAPDMLTWIALALLPHVLKLDDEQGGSLIGNAVVNICKAADDQINDPWLTIADVRLQAEARQRQSNLQAAFLRICPLQVFL